MFTLYICHYAELKRRKIKSVVEAPCRQDTTADRAMRSNVKCSIDVKRMERVRNDVFDISRDAPARHSNPI